MNLARPACAEENAPLGKKRSLGEEPVFVETPQLPDASREIRFEYDGWTSGRSIYAYVGNDPLNATDPLGLYWFRQPWQTDFVVGRDRSRLVEPGDPISRLIEDRVPAGRTFGEMHDRFVDAATRIGIPDLLANIPSMIPVYGAAVVKEVLRTLGILDQPTPQAQPTPSK